MHTGTFMMDGCEYRTNIFHALKDRLNYMVDRFSRTFVVRLDIRFPLGYTPKWANVECSELLRRFKEQYTYHNIVMHYVGVREQKTSANPHYHLVILFDGAREDNGWAVRHRAGHIWSCIVGPGTEACVQLCLTSNKADGVKIQKPRRQSVGSTLVDEQAAFNATYEFAMNWLPYLAKTATKGDAPFHTREFFCSRLP
jgi:hypothetical protein